MSAKQVCMVDHHGAPCPGYPSPRNRGGCIDYRRRCDAHWPKDEAWAVGLLHANAAWPCSECYVPSNAERARRQHQSSVDKERWLAERASGPPALPCGGICFWCDHHGSITVRVSIDQEGTAGEVFEFCNTVCYLAWHDSRRAE